MRLLIVSATPIEIAPLLDHLSLHWQQTQKKQYVKGSLSVDLLHTGIGGVFTCFHLSNYLRERHFDRIINAGIAGSFQAELDLGQVVEITSERFGDLGAEDRDGTFLDAFQLGLIEHKQPFTNEQLINPTPLNIIGVQTVSGISVNKTSGMKSSIQAMNDRFQPEVETMEGAAFFYTCLELQRAFAAIRSISNYVEPRNRANWNIKLAVNNLNKMLIEAIETNQLNHSLN